MGRIMTTDLFAECLSAKMDGWQNVWDPFSGPKRIQRRVIIDLAQKFCSVEDGFQVTVEPAHDLKVKMVFSVLWFVTTLSN